MSSNFLNDENKGDIIIYQSESGETKIDVRFQDETVWLTQAQMEELFQSSHEPHAKDADLLWACGLCAGFTGIDNYIQKENKGLSADSALPCAVDDRPLLSCCRTGTVRYGVLRSKECVSP